MISREKYRFLFQPWAVSLFSVVMFFVAIFTFFRPGYEIDDDLTMISLASGYLGGKALPFLAHSNVLWGFFLSSFYKICSSINWQIWFFILLNLISLWALIYTLLFLLPTTRLKLFATVTVLLCDVYFLTNITFTMIAAFSSITGFCLILTAIQSPLPLKKSSFPFGVALVLMGSLIRIKAMLLIAALILPVSIWFYSLSQLRKQTLALIILGISVLSVHLFNELYLQVSPDWAFYQAYDSVRTEIQDTPRKVNISAVFTEVGWSKNDLKVFLNWFFPDKSIYSIENLQYLVEHVPDKQESKTDTLITVSSHFISPACLPYLLIIFSTWLLIWTYGLSKKVFLPLSTILVSLFALSFYLAWAMKIPNRALISLLTAAAIFGLYIFICDSSDNTELVLPFHQTYKNSALYFASIAAIVLATGLVISNSIKTTKANIVKQTAYQNILSDLKNLQDQGVISQKALIISPANGFPFDWANPLTLSLPNIQVLEMGWLTFSPAYEKVLQTFDAQPMPESLYEKENVYLITPGTLLPGILDFIKEHKGLDVGAVLIYQIPETDIKLYKLKQ